MIARFPGDCLKCGVMIPKGAECDYNAEARRIQHRICPSASEAEETAEALADRLGFRHFSWEDLIGK